MSPDGYSKIETHKWDEADQNYAIIAMAGENTMTVAGNQEETVLYLKRPIACLMPLLYDEAMLTQ